MTESNQLQELTPEEIELVSGGQESDYGWWDSALGHAGGFIGITIGSSGAHAAGLSAAARGVSAGVGGVVVGTLAGYAGHYIDNGGVTRTSQGITNSITRRAYQQHHAYTRNPPISLD